jgi:hypothetical protein
MTEGRRPGVEQGKEHGAKSPDRRARLAKALKANIARRKASAQAAAASDGEEGKSVAKSEACDELSGPAAAPADPPPGSPRTR